VKFFFTKYPDETILAAKMNTHKYIQQPLVFVMFGLLLSVARGQSPQAVIETSVRPEGDLAFKHSCELTVRFLTDGFAFPEPPMFPDITLAGAIVIPPTSGMNLTDRRSGETWIGIERRYQVYPTRPGSLTIPSVTLQAKVRSSNGVDNVTATSQPVTCTVVVPVEMQTRPEAVVTPELKVTQTWEPDANAFKVGEAIERVVTVTADNTTAMLLPPLTVVDINGVSHYPSSPGLNDRDVRGTLTATRTDRVTTVFEQIGSVILPEITLTWWNPQTGQLQVEVLPGLAIDVAENPDLAAAQTSEEAEQTLPSNTKRPWLALVGLVVAILMVAGVYRRYGSVWMRRWQVWKAHRTASEPARFRRFQQACKRHNPDDALQALRAWLDQFQGVAWTLNAFCDSVDSVALRQAVDELNGHLFGRKASQGKAWSGQALSIAAAKARLALRKKQKVNRSEMPLCEMYPKNLGFGVQETKCLGRHQPLTPEP
jgi:hypothetical protein